MLSSLSSDGITIASQIDQNEFFTRSTSQLVEQPQAQQEPQPQQPSVQQHTFSSQHPLEDVVTNETTAAAATATTTTTTTTNDVTVVVVNRTDTYYIAIRKSPTVQNCVFWNWKDAQGHLDSTSEWKRCHSIKEVEEYLFVNNDKDSSSSEEVERVEEQEENTTATSTQATTTTRIPVEPLGDTPVFPPPTTTTSIMKTTTTTTATTPPATMEGGLKPESSKQHQPIPMDHDHHHNYPMADQPLLHDPTISPTMTTMTTTAITTTATDNRIPTRKNNHDPQDPSGNPPPPPPPPLSVPSRKPHVKWLQMLERLKLYHQTYHTFEIIVPLKRRGRKSSYTPATSQVDDNDKDNHNDDATTNDDNSQTNDDSNSNEEMLEATTKSKVALRLWLQEQNQQFANLVRGYPEGSRKSSMTEEKIQLLRDIGYEFDETPITTTATVGVMANFDDHLAQLQTLMKNEHPNNRPTSIPRSHPLFQWTQQMKVQLTRFHSGKKSSLLTAQQMNQLESTGYFDTTTTTTAASSSTSHQSSDDIEWDIMYEQLREFKKIHGDCLVNTTNWRDPLVKWVLAQRRHYLIMEEGGTSQQLTTKKLMMLHSIGFVFRQKEKYKTFEERVQELRDYKAKHGTLRVPTNRRGLGAFVAYARDQYRLSQMGRKHTMSEEKFDILQSIGFEFKIGKTPTVTCPTRSSWEDRFQQLLQYKEEFGDTIVPQNFSGYNNLGAWVKSQRGNYKRMKQGIRSSMTMEMALKLSEIGFVWEASTGGGGGNGGGGLKRKIHSTTSKKLSSSSSPSSPGGDLVGVYHSSTDSDSDHQDDDDEPTRLSRVRGGGVAGGGAGGSNAMMLTLGSSSPSSSPPSRKRVAYTRDDSSRRYYDFL